MRQLLALRLQANLSQAALGELIGVTRFAIINWEHGETSPNAEQIKRLAEVFGVTPNDLLTDD